MKNLSFIFILSILFASLTVSAQYGYDDEVFDDSFYPGYLGDNFSLEGALETFKNSRSVEDFEFRINNQDNYVNNLDLNNDGRADFVRVSDQSNDRRHRLLVLQAVLGRRDVQDIAVIAIQKTGRRKAELQIIGDEFLFGPDMILEPQDIAYNQNNRGYGPSGDAQVSRFFVNVYFWPSVRNLFRPRYSYYSSPYYWDYYPRAWNPWRPFGYATYYDRCGRYRRGFFRTVPTIRIVYVNNYYRPNRRTYSPWIRDRYNRCEVVYRRDRERNGNRRRDFSQTRPERRKDYDVRRGVVYDRKNDRGINGTNTGKPNREIRNERGATRVDRNSPARDTRVERSTRTTKDVRTNRDSYGSKTKSTPTTKRSDYGSASAPSRTDRGSSKTNKSYKPSNNRGSYGSDRKATSKPRRSSYGNDRRSTSEPKGNSYGSSRKSSSKPSSSYKSDRRSSTKKSNSGYSSSRKSSSASSAPKRSSKPSVSRKPASRPSKSTKSSNRGSVSKSSKTSKRSSKSGKKF